MTDGYWCLGSVIPGSANDIPSSMYIRLLGTGQ